MAQLIRAPKQLVWDLEHAPDQLPLLPPPELRETWEWFNPTPAGKPLQTPPCQPAPHCSHPIWAPSSLPRRGLQPLQNSQLSSFFELSHPSLAPVQVNSVRRRLVPVHLIFTKQVSYRRRQQLSPRFRRSSDLGTQKQQALPPAASQAVWPGLKHHFPGTLGLVHASREFTEHVQVLTDSNLAGRFRNHSLCIGLEMQFQLHADGGVIPSWAAALRSFLLCRNKAKCSTTNPCWQCNLNAFLNQLALRAFCSSLGACLSCHWELRAAWEWCCVKKQSRLLPASREGHGNNPAAAAFLTLGKLSYLLADKARCSHALFTLALLGLSLRSLMKDFAHFPFALQKNQGAGGSALMVWMIPHVRGHILHVTRNRKTCLINASSSFVWLSFYSPPGCFAAAVVSQKIEQCARPFPWLFKLSFGKLDTAVACSVCEKRSWWLGEIPLHTSKQGGEVVVPPPRPARGGVEEPPACGSPHGGEAPAGCWGAECEELTEGKAGGATREQRGGKQNMPVCPRGWAITFGSALLRRLFFLLPWEYSTSCLLGKYQIRIPCNFQPLNKWTT